MFHVHCTKCVWCVTPLYFLTTNRCTRQLTTRNSVTLNGSRLWLSILETKEWILHHGWMTTMMFGFEILVKSCAICWQIPTLQMTWTIDRFVNMIQKPRHVIGRISCRVIGLVLRFHGFANTCFPFWIVMLTDAMCSTDVSTSRATCLHTYHMLPVRLLVCSLFRFMCFFTVLLWIVDSSMLTILSYAYPIQLVDSSAYSLFPDSWLIYFLCLFVLVSRSLVYIRLGMRTRSSSSIYFATTLQVRPARSHILSLSLIAHWPRLLLCDLLKGVNSPFSVISLTSSEVQPTHVLRYACNSVKRWV